MEQYLQRGVKEVIELFPEVGTILERYGVGCVGCAVGTCALADVIEIHALPPGEAAGMMAEIEGAIHPGQPAASLPVISVATPATTRAIAYSPPVRKLVEEHSLIKRLVACIPSLVHEMRATCEVEPDQIAEVLDFIRGYADRFHHMKEEDILFDYTDREAEVIQVMYADHTRARALVKETAQAAERGDVEAVCANLTEYAELLADHIRREDEILYPYIDRGLTTHSVGEIARRFQDAEHAVGAAIPAQYEEFAGRLERQIQEREAEQCRICIKDVPAHA